MRDSIQLDQYVLQPLVKGSNSQISILTLDPDSPPFQTHNAQQNYLDDSFDDIKNEMDFFSIDTSHDHQKNLINFNLSAMNTTSGSQSNVYFPPLYNSSSMKNRNNADLKYSKPNNNLNHPQNQCSGHPLLLQNSMSDVYPASNCQKRVESSNITNIPLTQFNYVNTSTTTFPPNSNNKPIYFYQQQHQQQQQQQQYQQQSEQELYAQLKYDFKNNKKQYAQQYHHNNLLQNQFPQFQKSNSAAFSSSSSQSGKNQQQQQQQQQYQQLEQQLQLQNQIPSKQNQQNTNQQQQNIYFQPYQQQFQFIQQNESSFYSQHQSPQTISSQPSNNQSKSTVFLSPQFTPTNHFQSPPLMSQQGPVFLGNEQAFQGKEHKDDSDSLNDPLTPIYNILQTNSISPQQQNQIQDNSYQIQNQQFIPNNIPIQNANGLKSQNQNYQGQQLSTSPQHTYYTVQSSTLQQQNQQIASTISQQQQAPQSKNFTINYQNTEANNSYINNNLNNESNIINNQFIENEKNNVSSPPINANLINNQHPQSLKNIQSAPLHNPQYSNSLNNTEISQFSNTNNSAYSPFFTFDNPYFIQQFERELDELQLPTPSATQQSTIINSARQHLQQFQIQDFSRQKKISFQEEIVKQDSSQQPSHLIDEQQQTRKSKKSHNKKQQLKKRESVSSNASSSQKMIKKCIQKNCSGVAYKHYQPSSPINSSLNIHRTLIIKQIIHHEQNQHDKNCFNLYNEYILQSNLEHKHILQPIQMQLVKDVKDHPHTKGGCYIIYPKAQSDMYDYCLSNPHQSADIEEIRKMMQQVSSAIYFIHEVKNIVHCDIKPENIFKLTKDHFVLADFGLAHYITSKDITPKKNSNTETGSDKLISNGIESNPSSQKQINIIKQETINKSILSDQNDEQSNQSLQTLQTDNDQVNKKIYLHTQSSSNRVFSNDVPQSKSTYDNQYETSEGLTLDCTSQEQQQTLDSQFQSPNSSSESSSSSSSSSLNCNQTESTTEETKLKSCFHCYPQNLPDYVYANINHSQQISKDCSQQSKLEEALENDDEITQDCDEDSDEDEEEDIGCAIEQKEKINDKFLTLENNKLENIIESNDLKEEEQEEEEEIANDEQQEKCACERENDILQNMNLCDEFSFKTRQSDYFSPEIIRYQSCISNGISKEKFSKRGIDQIDEKKADIFALGMTLFVCLFKSYPYLKTCCQEDQLYKYLGLAEKKQREQFWSKFVSKLERYANEFDDSRVHELKDLIEKMLHPNPSQRLSIKEVISHPWLQSSQ